MRAGYYPGWEQEVLMSSDEVNTVEYDPNWREEALKNQVGKSYGMVWIDVETNTSPNCGWKSDHAANCQWLGELTDALKAKGLSVGIYLSSYMWQTIMGSQTACKEIAAKTPHMWYAHYDGVQTFNDYKQIGGWTKPNAKQYKGTTATTCSISVDLNWYP